MATIGLAYFLEGVGDLMWGSDIKKLDVGHLRFEINSKFIGIVSDDEPCLELEIELNFCQSSGKMRILIPFQTLYPIRERLF